MSDANYFKAGDYNVKCDFCQRKRKRSECQLTWENYMACSDTCYDPRHPSTLPIPAVVDALPVMDARPRQTGTVIAYAGLNTYTLQQNLLGNWGDYTWDAADFYWDDGSGFTDNFSDYNPDDFWPLN